MCNVMEIVSIIELSSSSYSWNIITLSQMGRIKGQDVWIWYREIPAISINKSSSGRH